MLKYEKISNVNVLQTIYNILKHSTNLWLWRGHGWYWIIKKTLSNFHHQTIEGSICETPTVCRTVEIQYFTATKYFGVEVFIVTGLIYIDWKALLTILLDSILKPSADNFSTGHLCHDANCRLGVPHAIQYLPHAIQYLQYF